MSSVLIRRARTADVPAVASLVERYSSDRILLAKAKVTLYEDVQEFWVAELDGAIIGCGALHVLWDDLAEIRTLAVEKNMRGTGTGRAIVEKLAEAARELGIARLFCLTFEVDFFARNGFEVIEGTPIDPDVYQELLLSYDEGVAEFLDLERVKPNTLGNTRMLRVL
ncbi:unannotated protein [freshwater metagenome]|uniref:Unannotated protein n=1 Tax=freshwater metagenome TaxID=449393 RepID=A0A6J7CPZ4_9ZZZZ|nr:amino-acid N-acetyltransferase [Actinomycetota bacterium]